MHVTISARIWRCRYTAFPCHGGRRRLHRCDADFGDEVTLRSSLKGADAVVLSVMCRRRPFRSPERLLESFA